MGFRGVGVDFMDGSEMAIDLVSLHPQAKEKRAERRRLDPATVEFAGGIEFAGEEESFILVGFFGRVFRGIYKWVWFFYFLTPGDIENLFLVLCWKK